MSIERKLYLTKVGRFEKWLKGRELVEARDFQRFVDQKIESLARQLAAPLDRPTWGPGDGQQTGTDRPAGVWSTSDLFPADVTATIDGNMVLSERAANYLPLYIAATVLGILIMSGALVVDFMILNEFWTRAMFPDFARDLADDFGGSAFAKSLQVVFATIAFHFFLTTLGPSGRKGFIWFLFAVALFVIVGLGVLNAGVTAPAGSETRSPSGGLGGVLEGLGLSRDAAPAEADPAVTLQSRLEELEGALWILIPSVIFLIVTGIASLSLQMAESNLRNIVRGLEWRLRRKRAEELEEMQIIKDFIDRMVGQPRAYARTSSDEDSNVVAFPKT